VRYCERAFLVFLLPNYAASEESVQRRGRKVFFVDGAVRYAALLRGLAPLDDPREMGLLIENMVATHLHALAEHLGARLYHWRQKKAEVDFFLDLPGASLAFEITGAARHSRKGLFEFQEAFPKYRGHCYLVSADFEFAPATHDEPGRIPLDAFLVAVGSQTQRAQMWRLGIGE
jgi:predicted AAA+ superfamily ATPase